MAKTKAPASKTSKKTPTKPSALQKFAKKVGSALNKAVPGKAKPAAGPMKKEAPKKPAKPLGAAASPKKPEKMATDKTKAAKPTAMSQAPAAVKLRKKDGGKGKKKSKRDDDEFLPEAEEGGEELPDLEDFDEDVEARGGVVEEDIDLDDELEEEEAPPSDEVILTDAEGRRYCKVKDCDQISSVEGYCRFHYLLLWKKIQVRRKILADGKLERYVEELTARYPDKFLEMIRRDLKTEKDFLDAIAELEIDESSLDNEYEDEAQSYIDEVRGVSETGAISDEEDF